MEDKKYLRDQIISAAIIAVSVIVFAVILIVTLRGKGKTEDTEAMPNIVGYSIDDVKNCYGRYFSLEVIGEEYSDYGSGVILSQSIAADEAFVPGDTVVKVVVSAERKPEEPVLAAEAGNIEEEKPEEKTETSPPVNESDLVSGLIIDNPTMDFEYLSQGDPTSVITIGIDESDEDMKALLDELYEIISPRCSDAGFLYVDLETGASVEYNADERFAAASIVKAPYIRAVLGQENDLGKKFEMTEEMLNSPSELVNGEPVGTEFTIEELAKATISRSDNTAYKMLYNYIGYDCFNELSSALNIPHQMTEENYWFRMTARHTAVYFKDIYYFTVQHKNGGKLKEYLQNSERNDLFADELKEYTVCEKYGYLPQEDVGFYTLGDAAVVFADKPYIIVGYVRGGTASGNLNRQYFHDTARLADNIHQLLHRS